MPSKRTDTERDASQAWGEWIAGMGEWHVFGALTYDERRRPVRGPGEARSRPHPEAVLKHARQWLQEGERRLGRQVEAAVVALEYHKRGWPHLHPLVRLAGGLQGTEFATLGGTWYERHGYAQLTEPRDQVDVASYAAKYLTKDIGRGDVLLWPARGPLSSHQEALYA